MDSAFILATIFDGVWFFEAPACKLDAMNDATHTFRSYVVYTALRSSNFYYEALWSIDSVPGCNGKGLSWNCLIRLKKFDFLDCSFGGERHVDATRIPERYIPDSQPYILTDSYDVIIRIRSAWRQLCAYSRNENHPYNRQLQQPNAETRPLCPIFIKFCRFHAYTNTRIGSGTLARLLNVAAKKLN